MSNITLGIIGGGQLGSMLAISAKKLNIKSVIYCDDPDAPAQNPYAFSQYDDPIGGNFLIEGSLQLIFKLPMVDDTRSMRSAFFIDYGNVFSTDCLDYQLNCSEPSIDELRYSIGIGVTWMTGFGPMSFSFSQPFNDGPFDRTEEFQFNIGTSL